MCRLSLCSTYHTFYLDLISPTKPRGCKSAATLPEWWVDAATSIARCMDMAICRFNGPDRVSPRKSRIMRVTLVLQPGVAYANCSRLRHHKLSCNVAGCNCQLCRFTITRLRGIGTRSIALSSIEHCSCSRLSIVGADSSMNSEYFFQNLAGDGLVTSFR